MHVRQVSLLVWMLVIGVASSWTLAQESRRGRSQGNHDQQDAAAANAQQGNAQQNGQPGQDQGRRDRGRDRGRSDRGTSDRGPGDRGPSDRGPGSGGDRGSWRDRFSRGGPPREITPEDRERFYSGMVDRYMERYGRNYELTDEQKQQVRAKMEELKTQQRAFSEQHWGEFQSMREEFGKMRESGQYDPQRAEQLRQKFDELRHQSPLFDDNKVVGEVEKLLPPEQVERGRARNEAEHAEREQRREQFRREWEQRRQQREAGQDGQQDDQSGGDQQGAPRTVEGGVSPGMTNGQPAPDQHGGHGDRSGRDWRERRSSRDHGGSREHGGEAGAPAGGEQSTAMVSEAGVPIIRENPVGPWEQYVRDFVRQYRLDATQQATAESVLREVKERRTAYELSHKTDFEQAKKIDSSSDREKRMTELNRPIVSAFEELKVRLMRIPSSAQRQMAGVRTTTSRPASSTTRPARD